MNKEYHCKNCSYFFGKEGIHCAVHPYGKESKYCGDWQQKTLSLQVSYTKFARCLLAMGATFLVGYQLYQNIPPAIRADKNYDIYKIKCEVFLERASQAGTTGVAKEELAKAVNWLESNSSTQDFEYRDLRANLDYLDGQPEDLAMPVSITGSISSNLENIEKKQLKLRDEGRPGIGSLTDFVMYILASILICLLILVLLATVMELIGV